MKDLYLKQNHGGTNRKRFYVALVALFAFFCSVTPLQAQDDCYKTTRATAINYMNKKDYANAIKYFKLAKGCPDKAANNDLDAKIKECEKLQAKAAKDKKDAEDKRRQEQEEANRREEQERMEREIEQEQERQMARTAYMQITRVDFINCNSDGASIPNSGILYWQDIKYIKPIIHYNGLADGNRYTTIYCKIFKPNNTMLTWSDSPTGYSYSYDITVHSGNDHEQSLTSWGSQAGGSFTEGTYTFEIYNESGGLIDSRQFIVFDKPPTSINVTFTVDDKNAYIYIDNNYAGQGSCSTDLKIGQTYEVETRKASHTSPYIRVTAQKGMNTNIKLEKPQPIYGSLSVSASKKDVDVYINDNYKGKAPQYFSQLLIGDYNVKLTKEKYNNYTQTVTIKANQETSVYADMQKPYRQPWLTSRPRYFAKVFINPVYAFDYGLNFDYLGSAGGHITICSRHLGIFAQYLHGIENKSQSYSGGLVLRLTNSIIDVQLLGGVAYNKMYTPYGYTYSDKWMGNAGMRISWPTERSLGLWDLLGGVMLDGNNYIPYVGVGFGTSLVGGLVALGIYAKNK